MNFFAVSLPLTLIYKILTIKFLFLGEFFRSKHTVVPYGLNVRGFNLREINLRDLNVQGLNVRGQIRQAPAISVNEKPHSNLMRQQSLK